VLRSHQPTTDLQPFSGLIVTKGRVASNGDYNLSAERYREGVNSLSQYPHVTLREVCAINPEAVNPVDRYPGSFFNYIDISSVENESGRFLGAKQVAVEEAPSRARRLVRQGDVLISTVRPNLKAFTLLKEIPDRAIASTGFAVLRADVERILPEFLISVLRHEHAVSQMIGMMGKGAYPRINQSDVESVRIPLPPLDVQTEIVAEIEGYQKVISANRELIFRFEKKIQATLARVWGEDEGVAEA
jgi:restriction endonuclease S subunit